MLISILLKVASKTTLTSLIITRILSWGKLLCTVGRSTSCIIFILLKMTCQGFGLSSLALSQEAKGTCFCTVSDDFVVGNVNCLCFGQLQTGRTFVLTVSKIV
jgi:hypothetical protein